MGDSEIFPAIATKLPVLQATCKLQLNQSKPILNNMCGFIHVELQMDGVERLPRRVIVPIVRILDLSQLFKPYPRNSIQVSLHF